jgi:hypothetical protein
MPILVQTKAEQVHHSSRRLAIMVQVKVNEHSAMLHGRIFNQEFYANYVTRNCIGSITFWQIVVENWPVKHRHNRQIWLTLFTLLLPISQC